MTVGQDNGGWVEFFVEDFLSNLITFIGGVNNQTVSSRLVGDKIAIGFELAVGEGMNVDHMLFCKPPLNLPLRKGERKRGS